MSILWYNKLGKYDIRRISDMKINISSKNYPMSEKLSNYIEKKLEKIGKYFDEDTTANIVEV